MSATSCGERQFRMVMVPDGIVDSLLSDLDVVSREFRRTFLKSMTDLAQQDIHGKGCSGQHCKFP